MLIQLLSMKGFLLSLFLGSSLIFGITVNGQTKKPTLMILPSDNWCVQRYFVIEFDNQGTVTKVPNYKQVFQEDTEIGQVISKIGSLLIDRGYPLKDAEKEIQSLEQQAAEDNMTASTTSGSSIAESPFDKLRKRAKADIIIQIWWSVNKVAEGKIVNFTLEAFDSYTNKRIAASTGSSTPSNTEILPVLLQKAVLSHIDPFMDQLLQHFGNMTANGREINVKIKKWQNWQDNLETEFNGKELNDIIDEWFKSNTVKGQFNISDQTENFMNIEQVRIPLMDAQNKAVDARSFIRELQKYLKNDLKIESKLLIKGLGDAQLILGEK
jgi:hypothetical protein